MDNLNNPEPIIFTLEYDNLETNFNLYRDVGIDKWMCSQNCPCEDVVNKSEWASIPADAALVKYDRRLPIQFGPLPDSTFTVTSYKECIIRALESNGENLTDDFRYFVNGWVLSAGFDSEDSYLRFFED